MKITCSACQASYNLPDEKVAGRRVKVRCKRCGEPIVVDGAAAPPPVAAEYEDEATRVMSSPVTMGGAPAMWTVNLSETEQGDMTDEELLAGWQAGIVTEDAYVWREGMDDWKALLDVPELVALLSAYTAPAATASAPVQPKPAAAAAAPSAPSASVPAAPKPKAATPGLGATPLAAAHVIPKPQGSVQPPRRNNADLFADKPKPRREKPKEASRNENSVLFSLDALKAAAGGEDHGPVSARIDEDLLTMGSSAGGVELLNAPLIDVNVPAPVQQTRKGPSRAPMPVASMPDSFPMPKQQSSKSWLWAVVIVVVLGGGGFYAYANGLVPGVATAPSVVPSAVPEPPVPAASASVEAPTVSAQPSEPSASAAEPAADIPKSGGHSAAADRGSSPDRGSQEPGNDKPVSGGEADKPPSSSGGDKSKEKEKPEEASGAAFNTEAARAALNGAASQAASCKASDGPTGSGKVQVTFVPSGRVTSANVVGGPFGGTSVGGCIARTFRQARVPAFSGDPQTVSKSFTIP